MVGRIWVSAGHDVMFSTRHPERLRDTVGKLGPRALVGTSAEAARHGDVLLVAVPLPGASWDRT
jgi:8-hydroxy-5-deazaflavin:NADPH oxidoreductase